MDPKIKVKICGVTRIADIESAVEAGAAYLGFVFYPKSPRHLDPAQARQLAKSVPTGTRIVAVTVNGDDFALDRIMDEVPVDMIQLHGAESPQRVEEIRNRFGKPVMKAVGLREPSDVDQIANYLSVADQLLIDAKAPSGRELPGGNGLAFDWRLIAGVDWKIPWMLAGGLDPHNVGMAIRSSNARQVDVSSGVESKPGQKDARKISNFIKAARGG